MLEAGDSREDSIGNIRAGHTVLQPNPVDQKHFALRICLHFHTRHQLTAAQDRQHVIAVLPLGNGGIDLPFVIEAE
ncbi:hypothetical protein D3C75_623220 [compost metagenome]